MENFSRHIRAFALITIVFMILSGAFAAPPAPPPASGAAANAALAAPPAAPPAAPSAEVSAIMSQPPKPGYPRPAIVSKAEWGAKPAMAERLSTHTLKCITVHHGGVVYKGKPAPKESLRNLQSWGMAEKKWGDVPYHFEIDLNGVIYECRDLRYAGDTNTSYKPAGHALPCVMGNYEEQQPNEKQLNALADLSAWLCSANALTPASIKGHKDYTSGTVCPGKNLYPYVQSGDLARRTAERLLAGGYYTKASGAPAPAPAGKNRPTN